MNYPDKNFEKAVACLRRIPDAEIQIWHPSAFTHIEIISSGIVSLPSDIFSLLDVLRIDFERDHVGHENHVTLIVDTDKTPIDFG